MKGESIEIIRILLVSRLLIKLKESCPNPNLKGGGEGRVDHI